jgi:hypothetical protein
MKRLLNLSLIIILLSAGCGVNAQTKKAVQKKKAPVSLDSLLFKRITPRLEIGFNNTSTSGTQTSATYYNGLKVGLTADYNLKNNLSLMTGILYTLAYSNKLQVYPKLEYARYLTYGHFLQLPIHITYSLPVSKNFKFFAFGGPTLSYGLAQYQNVVSTYDNSNMGITSDYIDIYKSKLNQFDVQVGLGGGIQLKKYQIKAGYDWGLLNVNKLNTGVINQNGWNVSIAIKL